jgi:hypothetical protein
VQPRLAPCPCPLSLAPCLSPLALALHLSLPLAIAMPLRLASTVSPPTTAATAHSCGWPGPNPCHCSDLATACNPSPSHLPCARVLAAAIPLLTLDFDHAPAHPPARPPPALAPHLLPTSLPITWPPPPGFPCPTYPCPTSQTPATTSAKSRQHGHLPSQT